jgi:hypothetical protein
MGQLTRFEIARLPDVALGYSAASRGWNLLTSAQNAQKISSSPAALLLTPAQVAAIPPLASWKSVTARSATSLFDTLHDKLYAAYLDGNYSDIEHIASAFLTEHLPTPLHNRSFAEQRVHRFFTLKGSASTASERLQFHESLSDEQRAMWFSTAHTRIDLEKAQALAQAASGTGFADIDLLGGLHADLAFSVLAASVESIGVERTRFPNKYVDRVLEYSAFLPDFIFRIDACGRVIRTESLLAKQLAGLAAYNAKMGADAQASVDEGGTNISGEGGRDGATKDGTNVSGPGGRDGATKDGTNVSGPGGRDGATKDGTNVSGPGGRDGATKDGTNVSGPGGRDGATKDGTNVSGPGGRDGATKDGTNVSGPGGRDGATGTPGHHDACDCKCDDPPCLPIDPCCAEINWYVTELLTLKDETHCYKPSDIAYIENIAPYETRIRTHGFTRTVVETSEDETNTSESEERDHQVTDRFSLQKAIETNHRASLDVDAKLSGKIYGQKYEVNTSASLSKESAYREAREQARETVDRAALKIQVQMRKLRTRSTTVETTEQNKHKFKNDTAVPAVAKYFWVTQEKRGQLFSHGPALTLDLLIPSPSMLFTTMERLKRKKGEPAGPPTAPDKPVLSATDITADNYLAIASTYQISGYTPPPETPPPLTIGISVSKNEGSKDVTVPAGYTATSMSITAKELSKWFFGAASITLSFGGGSVSFTKSASGSAGGSSSTGLSNASSGAATIGGQNFMGSSYIAVSIELTPSPVDLGPWRNSIHALIMEKYAADLEKFEADLADYQAALAAYNEAMDERIRGRHPFACEEIMRTELKRSAIFMMCGEFDWPDVMNLKAQPCGMPWPNRKKADVATNNWYFFDRAFDWNLASFTFFDYFRNPMCKWVDMYEPDEPNFLFKAFLRAGYARIQVPVSPGMEEDAKTFIQTGGLWGLTGKRPANPNDPRWISVIEEIKHSYGCHQQDREGYAEAYPDPVTGAFDSRIRVYADRYWDPAVLPSGALDTNAMALDLNHEIFIDGIAYRIVSIAPDPTSPAYSATPGTLMTWIVGLERKFESAPFIDPAATPPLLKPYNYAVGALFVGAPFHFDLPTDLIWIGDQGNACLPCYPIDCPCKDDPADAPGAEDPIKGSAGDAIPVPPSPAPPLVIAEPGKGG